MPAKKHSKCIGGEGIPAHLLSSIRSKGDAIQFLRQAMETLRQNTLAEAHPEHPANRKMQEVQTLMAAMQALLNNVETLLQDERGHEKRKAAGPTVALEILADIIADRIPRESGMERRRTDEIERS